MSKRKLAFILPWREKVHESERLFEAFERTFGAVVAFFVEGGQFVYIATEACLHLQGAR